VIPALNEEGSIGDVVARALRYGQVIVVDDGSSDATGRVAAAAGADVVTHPRNRGYDGALNTGFARAAALGLEVAITLDADGQHDPRTLVQIIQSLDAGADVVIGVRDRRQRFSERVFALWGRLMWRIRDPLCGMKGYRMSVYADHGCFDSCRSIGTELAICAVVRGFRCVQVPVPTRLRRDAPRFGGLMGANYRILRALVKVTAIASRQKKRGAT
jgi:glycosyltransferase involved in cell wall biosynthesis